jgi:hypothetical protein
MAKCLSKYWCRLQRIDYSICEDRGEVLLIDEFEVRKVAHVPYRLVRNKLSALDDAHQNFAKPQMNN